MKSGLLGIPRPELGASTYIVDEGVLNNACTRLMDAKKGNTRMFQVFRVSFSFSLSLSALSSLFPLRFETRKWDGRF